MILMTQIETELALILCMAEQNLKGVTFICVELNNLEIQIGL
jgi:hypothetical protein